MNFTKMTNVAKKNIPFKHDGPQFSNPDLKQKSNVSFFKGKRHEKS